MALSPEVWFPLTVLFESVSVGAKMPPPRAEPPAVLLPVTVVPTTARVAPKPPLTPPPSSPKPVVRPPVMVSPSSVTLCPSATLMARRALNAASAPVAAVAALASPSALASMAMRPSPRMVRSCVIRSWPAAPRLMAPLRPAAKVTVSAPGLALAKAIASRRLAWPSKASTVSASVVTTSERGSGASTAPISATLPPGT